jgi:hypothetical protein
MSVPHCGRHDERPDFEECEACIAWYAAEEAYWRAYFGEGQIRQAVERDREDRENHGRVLTDDERMEEARRLK